MRNYCDLVIALVVTLNSIELSSQSESAPAYKGETSDYETPLLKAPLRKSPPLSEEPRVVPPLSEARLRPEPICPEPIRPEPIRLVPHRKRRSRTGPASLIINFAHPEPHGELTYQKIDYPAGFQMKQRNGTFISVPTNKPILSLVAANGYALGVLNQYYPWTFSIFFGIYAEFDGKPHRFKIPVEGGKPVVMHPDEEKVFHDFRQFDMHGKKY
ncbi:uncharacterized protein LOC117170261 [Belonocnema kinseyi]|uniref:uncharacterized protein LOC117170261 n=1 Tax=Belonocnema kinseyi TaxID=2817044 RepID=UPI00143D1965|nr:uncharacterized protein LOC117170261 [Belonocnema kinseyi]